MSLKVAFTVCYLTLIACPQVKVIVSTNAKAAGIRRVALAATGDATSQRLSCSPHSHVKRSFYNQVFALRTRVVFTLSLARCPGQLRVPRCRCKRSQLITRTRATRPRTATFLYLAVPSNSFPPCDLVAINEFNMPPKFGLGTQRFIPVNSHTPSSSSHRPTPPSVGQKTTFSGGLGKGKGAIGLGAGKAALKRHK